MSLNRYRSSSQSQMYKDFYVKSLILFLSENIAHVEESN